MRYIKEILKKNSIWVLVYIGLGIFNSFVANYKVDYFQKVIDGLADRTLAFAGVATYGFILLVNYGMNYLDNYPEKKLEHGIYLDFKLLSLRKISTIDYTEFTSKIKPYVATPANLFKGLRMVQQQEEMYYSISGCV